MALGIHTNIFSQLKGDVLQAQVQASYEMLVNGSSVFHPEESQSRDVTESYDPIVCGRTVCEMEQASANVSGDLPRCW